MVLQPIFVIFQNVHLLAYFVFTLVHCMLRNGKKMVTMAKTVQKTIFGIKPRLNQCQTNRELVRDSKTLSKTNKRNKRTPKIISSILRKNYYKKSELILLLLIFISITRVKFNNLLLVHYLMSIYKYSF